MSKYFVLIFLVFLAACGEENKNFPNLSDEDTDHFTNEDFQNGSGLKSFGSEENFENFVKKMQEARAVDDAINVSAGAMPESAAATEKSAAATDSITNNQEAGVDEGGIVKSTGDYLIVLRRGRLFSIATKNNGEDALALADSINAYPKEHSTQTWYDELLVFEGRIVVVGYSYGYDATEIGLFSLATDGEISHDETYFLRSSDYYSSRNYASRLIGSHLIFYAPLQMIHYDGEVILPAMARLPKKDQEMEWMRIIDVSKIIAPLEVGSAPTLHTITTCDLSSPEFSCEAKAVMGPYSRNFYVSNTSIYLWTSFKEGALLYRMPLEGDDVGAVLATGNPIDQFSFKEFSEQKLSIMLRKSGSGDAMWGPEFTDGAVKLLNVPLSEFSRQPVQMAESNYVAMANVTGYSFHNRFVGDHVLYGSETEWNNGNARESKEINIHHLSTGVNQSLSLNHSVERIEPMGDDAVVVGSDLQGLVFSALDLSTSTVTDSYVLPAKAQGEHRSHGFFYKDLGNDQGVLGLPIRSEGRSGGELFQASAEVIFLSLRDHHFTALGSLTSSSSSRADDDCEASCVDWYGNSRPIFWHDRTFALMGYDLVEGLIADNGLVEKSRLSFLPTATRP